MTTVNGDYIGYRRCGAIYRGAALGYWAAKRLKGVKAAGQKDAEGFRKGFN